MTKLNKNFDQFIKLTEHMGFTTLILDKVDDKELIAYLIKKGYKTDGEKIDFLPTTGMRFILNEQHSRVEPRNLESYVNAMFQNEEGYDEMYDSEYRDVK